MKIVQDFLDIQYIAIIEVHSQYFFIISETWIEINSVCIRFRVLYDNVISLLYDTYTSHVKNDIPLQEDFEENLVKSGKSKLILINEISKVSESA